MGDRDYGRHMRRDAEDRARPDDEAAGRSRPRRRSRSRSPGRDDRKSHHSSRHHHHHHHRHHRRSSTRSATSVPPEEGLPFGARRLSRSDLAAFKPLFAYYLDLQKGLRLRDLDEHQSQGRWKSFVGKWNRGELAEGWYDPEMFQRVVEEQGMAPEEDGQEDPQTSPTAGGAAPGGHEARGGDDDDSDDGYGPSLPPGGGPSAPGARRQGPGIPSLDDLELRREAAAEERQSRAEDLRAARRLDRAEQKARLDEALPRAEPGTRERQLEKKRLLNEKLRGFRDRSPGGGGAAEVAEGDLMGGGDSLDEHRRARESTQRRKTERELRREEMQRARAAEVEGRLRRYREREEETVGMLRELAKRRFG